MRKATPPPTAPLMVAALDEEEEGDCEDAACGSVCGEAGKGEEEGEGVVVMMDVRPKRAPHAVR